jgi:hypothetical protein
MVAKPKGEKPIERTVGVRVSDQFYKALNKSKWLLEKEASQIVREAIMEYWENHLDGNDLETIMGILNDALELDKRKIASKAKK